jgi:hypothetical protein
MAAGRGAMAEHFGAVIGDEQGERHRAGGGKPLSPRGSRLVDVHVERDAIVRGQPGARRLREQVVEPGGEFGWITGGEDCCKPGPGIAGIGQVTITDDDWFRLLMCQQKHAQVVRAGQCIAVSPACGRIHQRDRKAGPTGWPERRLRAHEVDVTASRATTCYGF